MCFEYFQDPAGIFELIEVVGNGTYGQVYKVSFAFNHSYAMLFCEVCRMVIVLFVLCFFFVAFRDDIQKLANWLPSK